MTSPSRSTPAAAVGASQPSICSSGSTGARY
jgi:hypothetical protein